MGPAAKAAAAHGSAGATEGVARFAQLYHLGMAVACEQDKHQVVGVKDAMLSHICHHNLCLSVVSCCDKGIGSAGWSSLRLSHRAQAFTALQRQQRLHPTHQHEHIGCFSLQGGNCVATPHTAPAAAWQLPPGLANGGATAAGDRRIVLLQDSLPRRGSGPDPLPGRPLPQAASTPPQLPFRASHGR